MASTDKQYITEFADRADATHHGPVIGVDLGWPSGFDDRDIEYFVPAHRHFVAYPEDVIAGTKTRFDSHHTPSLCLSIAAASATRLR
jgi:hypothetical protein